MLRIVNIPLDLHSIRFPKLQCGAVPLGSARRGRKADKKGPPRFPGIREWVARYLLGFNHEQFNFRYAGRDYRLTDLYGKVVKEIVA
jgi:hypothetical protein